MLESRNTAARITTTAGKVGDQGRETARVGGRRSPRAVGAAVATVAACPQGARQETTTADNRSSSGGGGLGSGAAPGRSQRRRTRLLADFREERRSDDAAGKNECRGRSGQLDHKHPPGGGQATSDGVHGQQQQGRVSASGQPAAAAAIYRTEANPASTEALRSGKRVGFSGVAAHDRQAAAMRVQSLFRGHKGRSRAAAEGRKRARHLAAEREAREERQRPSAACWRRGGRISRPKGPSTYGF